MIEMPQNTKGREDERLAGVTHSASSTSGRLAQGGDEQTPVRWTWRGTRVSAILFDVDGTLYDQRRLRRIMLRRLAGSFWYRPWAGIRTLRILQAYRRAQERLRAMSSTEVDAPSVGQIAREPELAERQFQMACGRGQAPEEMRKAVQQWMEEAPLPHLRPLVYDGLSLLLKAAREDGLKLGVFSDYPAADKLASMGLDGSFDVVVCAQDSLVQRFKPDPRGILEAIRRLELVKEEVLYVGDRPEVDAEAAARAGVRCFILCNDAPVPGTVAWDTVCNYRKLLESLKSDRRSADL